MKNEGDFNSIHCIIIYAISMRSFSGASASLKCVEEEQEEEKRLKKVSQSRPGVFIE